MTAGAEQLSLLAPPEVAAVGGGFYSGLPERDGAARYVHLIRSSDDPERAPRGGIGSTDWKRVGDLPVAEWARRIERHLADGEARTFNRLALELTGFTADVVFEETFDHGLWHAVEQGRVVWTAEAPVLFVRVGFG